MKLTKKDRIILINQYKILSILDKDEESYYNELIDILENGYSVFYSMIDERVEDDTPEEDSRLVLDILDLYRAIENIKRSTKDNKILNHHHSFFRGFDGNNETNLMSFCRFLIEKQGKFQEQIPYLLKNDNLNSHMPMRDKYSRMLMASKTIPSIWSMTPDQAIKILDA